MLVARVGTRALPLQEILEVFSKYISTEYNRVVRVPTRATPKAFFLIGGNHAP